METVEELPGRGRPVAPGRRPGRAARPIRPQHPEPFEAVLADVEPGDPAGHHPLAVAQLVRLLPGQHSGPSILGELLSAGLGVQGMLWATSPACTELETHVLDWMVELLGLPDRFRSDGAGWRGDRGQRVLGHALRAARRPAAGRRTPGPTSVTWWPTPRPTPTPAWRRRPGWPGWRRPGPWSSPSTTTFAMAPTALAAAVAEDRRPPAGRRSSAARRWGPPRRWPSIRCRRWPRWCAGTGVWLHVDGAMAGSAAVCPELRWVNDGPRPGRQLRLQPPQVAVHQLRLHLLLGGRPGRAARRALDPARVPAQRGQRVGRGHRLPGLAGPAGTPVPGPQALVRHPPLRRRGAGPPRAPSRRPGRARWSPGSRPTTGSRSPPRPASDWSACATSTATTPPRPCSTPSTRPASST